jgi:hypothetical protein
MNALDNFLGIDRFVENDRRYTLNKIFDVGAQAVISPKDNDWNFRFARLDDLELVHYIRRKSVQIDDEQ